MSELPNVVIVGSKVIVGGQELPGIIEASGVHVAPGGCKDVNRLTVTFLVGRVNIEDPYSETDYAI